jgi:predicted nucleotidyltransferase
MDKDTNSKSILRKRFEEILQRAKVRILKENPNVLGIIVDGSAARGDQGPYSDIDIIALTKPKSKLKKLFYFEDKIQVDIWFMAIDSYDKAPEGVGAMYARGPSGHRILFDKNGCVKKILAKWEHVPPKKSDIQEMIEHSCRNLIEYTGKVKNGWLVKDKYLIRYAAHMIAEAAQNPIIICNNIRIISENTGWTQLMEAKRKPKHFSIDYPICFGLVGETDTRKVYNSATRLAKESLLFIEQQTDKKLINERIKAMLTYKSESNIIE